MVNKSGLSAPTSGAASILKKIVDSIQIDELRSYERHINGKGVDVMIDADAMIEMSELESKGWIKRSPDAIFADVVYLTQASWELYQVAEWEEIENEVLMENRGSEFGSW